MNFHPTIFGTVSCFITPPSAGFLVSVSGSESGRQRPPPFRGDFDGQGAKQHKVAKMLNYQLITELTSVAYGYDLLNFLQILIYCDNRLRLLLKQFIC